MAAVYVPQPAATKATATTPPAIKRLRTSVLNSPKRVSTLTCQSPDPPPEPEVAALTILVAPAVVPCEDAFAPDALVADVIGTTFGWPLIYSAAPGGVTVSAICFKAATTF